MMSPSLRIAVVDPIFGIKYQEGDKRVAAFDFMGGYKGNFHKVIIPVFLKEAAERNDKWVRFIA